MKNLSLIVAIGKNNELGLNDNLIWNLKGDMHFFKETTIGHTVIMGNNTFKSLPCLLPNRHNIVITDNTNYHPKGVTIFCNIKEVLKYVEKSKDECFVIGGASIYKQFLEYCDTLYITEIDDSHKCDVYFPKISKEEYEKEVLKENIENNIKYRFVKYIKRGE